MNVQIEAWKQLFERDLNRIIEEVKLYQNEADLWKVEKDIRNSGGNLVLHLVGNLRHFIGHVLGGTEFQRAREKEFSATHVPKSELMAALEVTRKEVLETLEKMNQTTLDSRYPIDVLGHEMSVAFFVSHLMGHLNYHLGQINYHRRLIK